MPGLLPHQAALVNCFPGPVVPPISPPAGQGGLVALWIALAHLKIWGCDGLSQPPSTPYLGVRLGQIPWFWNSRNIETKASFILQCFREGVWGSTLDKPEMEHYLVNLLWASLCPLHTAFTWGRWECPGQLSRGNEDGSRWSRITLVRQQSCAQFSSYFGTKYTVSRETSFFPPPLHYAGYYNKIFPDAQLQ